MKNINLEELAFEDLKNLLGDIIDELKNRDMQIDYDDEGFDTLQTIDYLIGKYQQIVDARPKA